MTDQPEDVQAMLEAAMRSLAKGDKDSARLLAQQAADLAPDLEKPWLILAAVVPPEEKLQYVQKALELNPESPAAKKALDWAKSQLPSIPEIIQPGGEEPQSDQSPEGGLSNESQVIFEAEEAPELIEKSAGFPDLDFKKPCEPDTPQQSQPTSAIPAGSESPNSKPLVKESAVLPPMEKPISRSAEEQKPAAAMSEPAKHKTNALRIILLTLLILVIIAALVLWIFFRPLALQFIGRIFPAESCIPSLVLGSRLFAIKTIKPANDGSLLIPQGQPGMIYQVEGTTNNMVYGLSVTSENYSLSTTITSGSMAVVTQSDCSKSTYTLEAPVPGVPDNSALVDQSLSRITIFLPASDSSNGFVILGELKGTVSLPGGDIARMSQPYFNDRAE